MRPSLATVISSRPWEKHLVETAAESGLVRLVARCYVSEEVPHDADVVAVGSETPWLSRAVITAWRDSGTRVIGLFPINDKAAIAWLCRSEVDQLFVETADPVVILRACRDLAALPRRATASGSAADRVARRMAPIRHGRGRAASG